MKRWEKVAQVGLAHDGLWKEVSWASGYGRVTLLLYIYQLTDIEKVSRLRWVWIRLHKNSHSDFVWGLIFIFLKQWDCCVCLRSCHTVVQCGCLILHSTSDADAQHYNYQRLLSEDFPCCFIYLWALYSYQFPLPHKTKG